jgi:cytochrome c oxidase subunit II
VSGVQTLLAIGYGIVVLITCVVFAFVYRSARASHAEAVEHDRLAAGENRWGVVVVLMLIALLGVTITSLPYGRADAEPGAQVVQVQAQQFGWGLRPATVRAGRPVEFRLRSKDVQHGFGVYDGHELLFQVQVPAAGEPVQRYVHTFDRRGTFDILCLEFCGFQHHMMRGTLRVT